MKFEFTKANYFLLSIAILTTIAGYIVMTTGDKTLSTILLIVAYAVLFPIAIIFKTKK